MNIPTKKLNNGFEIPVLGLGTWEMGGRYSESWLGDKNKNVHAIQKAIELGFTHIDTAEMYANGGTEKLIGQAIRGFDRGKLFITSKVWPNHLQSSALEKALHGSLERLGTDYLDLYLIHWPTDDMPLQESIQTMNRLKDEGLIKHLGVSNFSIEELKEAQSYSASPIVCNQVHYSLSYREPETSGLLEFCQSNDVLLTAWRPLAKGVLATNPAPIIQAMVDKYKKSPAQIAINWLISQKNVITIPKSSSVKHLVDNLGAVRWQMEDPDIELLRNSFA